MGTITWSDLLPETQTLNKSELPPRLATLMSIANNRALATIENESEFQTRLMQYFSILIQSAPVHNALLNTKTYHPQNPSNPQFLDMVKAFGLKRTDQPTHPDVYTKWIRDKLLIPKHVNIDIDGLEKEINKICQDSIQLIKGIDEKLTQFTGEGKPIIQTTNARSPTFDAIHHNEMTVPRLLHLCFNYLLEFHRARKQNVLYSQQIQKGGIDEIKIQELENKILKNDRIMSDRNKSMFEIARIFAIMDTELRIKQAHGKGTQGSDKIFLVRKVLELFNLPEKEKEITIDTINQNDNPFFQLTTSEVLHWETMDRSGKYLVHPENKEVSDDVNELRLEGCILQGKVDHRGHTGIVNVRHIDFRSEKTIQSATLKSLRKDLESPHEILDHRGFRFVVDSMEDARLLCSMLAFELGGGPDAWKSPIKSDANGNSGSNFKCLKGILAIGHKRGDVKKLKGDIRKILEDENPGLISELDRYMTTQGYQLETEIQIFIGLDSYISAHHDTRSPAYHGNYKDAQLMELGLRLYPPSIFPKAHKSLTHLSASKRALSLFLKINSAIQSTP